MTNDTTRYYWRQLAIAAARMPDHISQSQCDDLADEITEKTDDKALLDAADKLRDLNADPLVDVVKRHKAGMMTREEADEYAAAQIGGPDTHVALNERVSALLPD